MEMGRVGIDRQSSIENEPRTLNINQIDFAREAALYVLNTRSIEEAVSIFTQGLEPAVVRCADDEGGGVTTMDIINNNGDDYQDYYKYSNEDELFRDIVSAPF